MTESEMTQIILRHDDLFDKYMMETITLEEYQEMKALEDMIDINLDKLMKAYISGRLSAHEVEAAYYSQMLNSPVHT